MYINVTGGDIAKPPADGLSMDQLAAELASVALDWKTLRNIRECGCSTPFDHFSRKVSAVIFNLFTAGNVLLQANEIYSCLSKTTTVYFRR